MSGSWKIGTLFGIGIYVHWTFWLLLAFVSLGELAGGSADAVLITIRKALLLIVLFGCVVLHELGHALAARRYGIPTRDITLLPIGGMARLARMPQKPSQELVVAIAGPAVNVVIAAVLALVLLPFRSLSQTFDLPAEGDFLQTLLFVNIALVLFNLLPAFPMDGGRVLRAVLAMFMGYAKATRRAAAVGQMMAILFGLLGLYAGNTVLVLIAVFVFFAAAGEARATEMRQSIEGYRVRDAMLTRFRVVAAYEPLTAVAPELLSDMQRDFPVVQEGRLVGMLRQRALVKALRAGGEGLSVGHVMETTFDTADALEPLGEAIQRAAEQGQQVLPVISEAEVVGLLDAVTAPDVVAARTRLAPPHPIVATALHD